MLHARAMSGRIVIIGSGETAPTLVKVQRQIVAEAAPGPRALLDTTYGFQVNRDDLTAKIARYFAESVGVNVEIAHWADPSDPAAVRQSALGLIGRAGWIFAGPGSPTYALRQWQDTPMATALTTAVRRGATLVMGSAAAVSLGKAALPVYEIYKAGEDLRWIPGLDLLGELAGIQAAVIPHYDNGVGEKYDTRYCYLGATRLERMEAMLEAGTGILGVDEHTAVTFDLAAKTVSVYGNGTLTIRTHGMSQNFAAGAVLTLDAVREALHGASVSASNGAVAPPSAESDSRAIASLGAVADAARISFDAALLANDAARAVEAMLELEEAIKEWSADTLQSADGDHARQVLRTMMVDLAQAAERGLSDTDAEIAPLVELALELRATARASKDFAASDLIRDRLASAGIEVRDTPDGMTWIRTT